MKKSIISLVVFMMTTGGVFAGGILTNTNQSVLFLKNPARDAAIGIDGVNAIKAVLSGTSGANITVFGRVGE